MPPTKTHSGASNRECSSGPPFGPEASLLFLTLRSHRKVFASRVVIPSDAEGPAFRFSLSISHPKELYVHLRKTKSAQHQLAQTRPAGRRLRSLRPHRQPRLHLRSHRKKRRQTLDRQTRRRPEHR